MVGRPSTKTKKTTPKNNKTKKNKDLGHHGKPPSKTKKTNTKKNKTKKKTK